MAGVHLAHNVRLGDRRGHRQQRAARWLCARSAIASSSAAACVFHQHMRIGRAGDLPGQLRLWQRHPAFHARGGAQRRRRTERRRSATCRPRRRGNEPRSKRLSRCSTAAGITFPKPLPLPGERTWGQEGRAFLGLRRQREKTRSLRAFDGARVGAGDVRRIDAVDGGNSRLPNGSGAAIDAPALSRVTKREQFSNRSAYLLALAHCPAISAGCTTTPTEATSRQAT